MSGGSGERDRQHGWLARRVFWKFFMCARRFKRRLHEHDVKNAVAGTAAEVEESLHNLASAVSGAFAEASGDAVDAATAGLLYNTQDFRKNKMKDFKEKVTNSILADPDMWTWVSNLSRPALAAIFDGLEEELEMAMAWGLLKEKKGDPIEAPRSDRCLMQAYLGFRKRVLHHYLPHDRSIFGKLGDPVFLFFYILLFMPYHWIRTAFFSVLLVLIVFPGPPDEFQLINFILSFKGTQFVSSGLIFMAKGVVKYYMCIFIWSPEGNCRECIRQYGAGASQHVSSMLVDYLGSVVLVWIAFLALPSSSKLPPVEFEGLGHARKAKFDARKAKIQRVQTRALEAEQEQTHCFGFTGIIDKTRGGRLRYLLWWDLKCFMWSIVGLVLFTLGTCDWRIGYALTDAAEFKENVYWCMVVYSFFSIPWCIFNVPMILKMLTEIEFTGYNEDGACVAYELPPVPCDCKSRGHQGDHNHPHIHPQKSRVWIDEEAGCYANFKCCCEFFRNCCRSLGSLCYSLRKCKYNPCCCNCRACFEDRRRSSYLSAATALSVEPASSRWPAWLAAPSWPASLRPGLPAWALRRTSAAQDEADAEEGGLGSPSESSEDGLAAPLLRPSVSSPETAAAASVVADVERASSAPGLIGHALKRTRSSVRFKEPGEHDQVNQPRRLDQPDELAAAASVVADDEERARSALGLVGQAPNQHAPARQRSSLLLEEPGGHDHDEATDLKHH